MNWSNAWTTQNSNPAPTNALTSWPSGNPWDALSQNELLTKHLALKQAVEEAKTAEMELRKYIVNRVFPTKHEGVNTLELGNGYELKAKVTYNYNLADNETVEKTLDKIAKIGNSGSFVADRLVSWKPSFLLTEYRSLIEAASASAEAQEILAVIGEMLTITDAAPTLDVKEPKAKRK